MQKLLSSLANGYLSDILSLQDNFGYDKSSPIGDNDFNQACAAFAVGLKVRFFFVWSIFMNTAWYA